MRSNIKKNEIYEIRLQKQYVNLKNVGILLSSVKSKMQNHSPTPITSVSIPIPIPSVSIPITSVSIPIPSIVDSKISMENDMTLQYVKSKIMSDYSELYKTL